MAEPLKEMYNARFLDALIMALRSAYPAFDRSGFLTYIFDADWDRRELKERMRHISVTLRQFLHGDYRTALDILRRAAATIRGFSFETMIFPDFVEVYGLDDWEASIPALEQFTQLCSSEYAVRPFILQDHERMMAQMVRWSEHENEHVRRLSSEGCRPRLPWAMALPALKQDPTPILPILERLKLDESEYVRRSVANNLNDIAKDNPQVVLDVLREWRAHDTPQMRWIIAHALRTLVKQGDPDALALLGYSGEAAFAVRNLQVEPQTVAIGDTITFEFEVESLSQTPQNVMIDYIVHHVRAGGQHIPKVFKLTKMLLNPGEKVTITRRHSFRPITTRRYYPGMHKLEIQVNGQVYARAEFGVIEETAALLHKPGA